MLHWFVTLKGVPSKIESKSFGADLQVIFRIGSAFDTYAVLNSSLNWHGIVNSEKVEKVLFLLNFPIERNKYLKMKRFLNIYNLDAD